MNKSHINSSIGMMGASTKEGQEIALESRKIVKSLIDDKTKHLPSEEREIVERIVHSTADPEYAELTVFSDNFVKESLKAVKNGRDILTDINMVRAGINQYEGEVKCYINHPQVYKMAGDREITRTAAAMEFALEQGFEGIVAIGNSPTALLKVIELSENNPESFISVIGVPVGFVAAADSKRLLHETPLPHMVTQGPKGGTPVAVATVNALLNLKKELD
jgi:precorrin-8X/cobalt-precorrin-8 methylmutase